MSLFLSPSFVIKGVGVWMDKSSEEKGEQLIASFDVFRGLKYLKMGICDILLVSLDKFILLLLLIVIKFIAIITKTGHSVHFLKFHVVGCHLETAFHKNVENKMRFKVMYITTHVHIQIQRDSNPWPEVFGTPCIPRCLKIFFL